MKIARLAMTIAYPVLLVLSSFSFAPAALKVLLLIAPVAILLNIWITQLSNPRLRLTLRVCVCLAVVSVCVLLFRLRHENLQWLIVLQESGVLLVMAGVFGITLLTPGDALCTRFIRFAHASPSAQLLRYSRQITVAWALFFLFAATGSLVLYFFLPTHIWALYNSFGIPICAIGFFCVENFSQRFFLTREERRTPVEVWKAIRATQASQKSVGNT